MADQRFRAVLAEHGLSTLLEPVEWQTLPEPPPAPTRDGLLGSPAALLEAHRAVVPFRGRTRLLDELLNWCADPGLGVRLIHGPAGQGKTRLAHQLAERLTGEEGSRWSVLWLSGQAPIGDLAELRDAAVPLLVIIDYAETRPEQLTALLDVLLRHPTATPLKLLLLARTRGDWWTSARRARRQSQELLDTAAVTELEPLDTVDRATAYAQAVQALSRALHQVRGQRLRKWERVAEGLSGPPESRLNAPGMDVALTLHMTVLADLLDAADRPVRARARETDDAPVEERLLDHEIRYWENESERRGAKLPWETLSQALAAAFLCGADDDCQADDLLRRVPPLAGADAEREHVSALIAGLYPPGEGRHWGTLQPDRLAEYFVGRQLLTRRRLPKALLGTGTPPGDRSAGALTEAQRVQMLTVYTRAAAHPAHHGLLDGPLTDLCVSRHDVLTQAAIDVATRVERPEPLVGALERIAQECAATPGELGPLAERLPRPTHTLAPLALNVTERLVGIHRAQAEHDPEHRAELALALRRLTGRLGDMGRRREAYEAAAEAVRLYKRLAEEDPAAFRAHHATSLRNLSVMLSKLGRRKKALKRAAKAVRILRASAASDAGDPKDLLAHGLEAVATAEAELGRPQEALTSIAEAVGIRRGLVEEHGDEFRPSLAAALNDHATWLKECGRVEEALTASEEAVGVYRSLAERRPDAYRAALAMGLGTHSICLHLMGRPREALKAAHEAVGIRRRLAEERPGTYRADLALSLNSLAIDLDGVGRPDEAVQPAAEAVSLYRSLAEKDPKAFVHQLANALNTYANQLHDTGRVEEALTAAEESAARYRSLAEAEPDRFTADLAMSLMTLASQLRESGRQEEALETQRESVALHRRLAERQPGVFRHDLASALNNLCLLLSTTGSPDAALAAVNEAADIQRDLMESGSTGRARPSLPTALMNKMSCLCDLGREQEAVPVAEEAVEHYRRLVEDDPDLYEPQLATALSARWGVLYRVGRTEEALTALTESVGIRGRLLDQDDAAQRPAYADQLHLLGSQLSAAHRHDEAVDALRKAVAVRRGPAQEDPTRQLPQLALSLATLGTTLMRAGLRREALPVAEEAVELLSGPAQQDETHRPLLAEALCTLGVLQHTAGREEARHTLRRAVRVCGELPRTDLRETLRHVSLHALGLCLADQGEAAEGLSLVTRAVGVARDLARINPAYEALSAGSLTTLSRLSAADPLVCGEALTISGEAVAISERLVESDPLTHNTLLAWALPDHGLRLAEAGRYEEALDATARAVDLSRRLVADHRTAHTDNLAFSLYAYARSRLVSDTETEQARSAIEEALPVWEAFAEEEPGLVAPYLDSVRDTFARLAGGAAPGRSGWEAKERFCPDVTRAGECG
ncbi:tetratricopeptide repeat family protein [Streptomyces viridochromogenes DSM 40736]|uniref:Tetratricopeptide repeat family protein n=2 Tax=Streptomyces viridochromogenes TaxID=1938 RepID=D9XFE9_STRVT|nr:tetratricopeptide repeat family protein [Streptomyces viridochromogenes DSM 40736]